MGNIYTNKEKESIFVERTQRYYPHIWDFYRKTIANEKMSKEELAAFNWERRKEIVTYAYERSPFYRQYYDSCGFHPNQLINREDWQKVPVITKEMLRRNLEAMKVPGEAEKYGKQRETSGSSGMPLLVLNDIRDAVPALYWRIRGWRDNRSKGELFGKEAIIGVNEATLKHIRPGDEKACVDDKIRQQYYPMEAINLNVSHQTEEEMIRFVKNINKIQPVYLDGNTGALYEFALFCKRNSIRFTPPPPSQL